MAAAAASASSPSDAADATNSLWLWCLGLYAANVLTHAFVFSNRNPTRQPSRQTFIVMLARLLFGLPMAFLQAAWLTVWIIFWEILRRPLWKPRTLPLPDETHVTVAFCGGGFRTWYHLGVYWGLYDALGVEGIRKVKFSGASIGALVAAVCASAVHPADVWAMIPAIAQAYREDMVGHLTRVGQFCRYLLNRCLPNDAHLLVEDHLFLSISSLLPVPHNYIQKEYTSREDLIDAVIAATYIPAWTFPGVCIHRGMVCVDGGVTNNLPSLCHDSLRVGLDTSDIEAWNADLAPSEPLTRINTFVPANEANLQRMLDCGKEDVVRWLKTARGRAFVRRVKASTRW